MVGAVGDGAPSGWSAATIAAWDWAAMGPAGLGGGAQWASRLLRTKMVQFLVDGSMDRRAWHCNIDWTFTEHKAMQHPKIKFD